MAAAAAIIGSKNFIFLNNPIPKLSNRSRSRPLKRQLPVSRKRVLATNMAADSGRSKFMEFPYASPPVRNLMVELVSMVEDRLGSQQLQPCHLPEDVQFYQNESGTSQASLHIRSGSHSSQVDFMLGSWLHFGLPAGGEVNITSLSAYLNSSTDAPNFLIELIQRSPASMVLILDLPPRKDLVLHPEYLQTFYEDTKLDAHRQLLSELPEVTPYVSSSLYIRSVVSPTAILVNIQAGEGGQERLEGIVSDHIHPVAIQVLETWLGRCALIGREVGENERLVLDMRDGLVKNKTIEIDLGSSLPRLFGQQTADRVLAAIRDVFSAKA
uniref:Red chlorophyll catabolite reductase n=1 Tax=Kalanchoe fedtschenkoi TaxID=63787 RepID=A0A7N0ULT1_KALFE